MESNIDMNKLDTKGFYFDNKHKNNFTPTSTTHSHRKFEINKAKIKNLFEIKWSNKKLFESLFCLNEYDEIEVNKAQASKSKRVIFADKLGMDLELIHTIKINNQADRNENEFNQLLTKQSFFNSYSQNNDNDDSSNYKSFNNVIITQNDKVLIPKFILFPDNNYEKLIKNGICLNSIEIYNQSSIRGIVLTLAKSIENTSKEHQIEISHEANNASDKRSSKKKLPLKSFVKNFLKLKEEKLILNLDLVYIIWSLDQWKTWKYQAAIQKNCKSTQNNGIVKTHEFFIQNLDNYLHINQRLSLIVCHQIDLVVYKDTNNELCYNFDCAIKI